MVILLFQAGEYEWDRPTRGILGSAVFFGYLVSNIPGGMLSQRYGPKWVHFGGILLAATASLLSPLGAATSRWALLVTRLCLGIGCVSNNLLYALGSAQIAYTKANILVVIPDRMSTFLSFR